MAKMGRPRAQIDQSQFEGLCKLQCTEVEICDWFSVTDKTLNRWCRDTYGKTFSEIYREKKNGGKISLRRTQWKLAEKSVPMAIFLGKNYLGQRDTFPAEQRESVEEKMADFIDVLSDRLNED